MSHIEAYGTRGKKRLAWRRTFATIEIMRRWADAHSALVIGTREVTAEEWHANRRAA